MAYGRQYVVQHPARAGVHLHIAAGRDRQAGRFGGGEQLSQACGIIRAQVQADAQPATARKKAAEPVRRQQVTYGHGKPHGQAVVESVLETGVGQGILAFRGIAPPARDQRADLGVARMVDGE